MWFFLTAAYAATVTELPPFLHGDGGLAYTFDRTAGGLTQPAEDPAADDLDVGQRLLTTQRLDYRATFAFAPGVAFTLDIPQYLSSTVAYDAAQEMVYDPGTGTGTYDGTDALEAGEYVKGGGFGGLWLEVGGTPFSEAFTRRNNKATWLVSLGVRTPDKSSLWTVDESGKRGAGPGGAAFKLASAFSKRTGRTDSYLAADIVWEGKTDVVLADASGVPYAGSSVELDPANHGSIKLGTEITAAHNDVSGTLVALDVHMATAYTAFGDVASGVYLPSVLDASLEAPVQQSESLEAGGGIGLIWRPIEFVQLHAWGEMYYHLPQRIESPYPVYTAMDTTRTVIGAELTIRLRDAKDAGNPDDPSAPGKLDDPWGQ